MKRIYLFSLSVVLLATGAVSADLTVYEYKSGEKVTLDTVTGNYWYWNLEDFVNITYPQQSTAIAGLGNYGGVLGGWHMASHTEVAALFSYPASEIGEAFAPTKTETVTVPGSTGPIVIADDQYWMGLEDHIVDPTVSPPWRYSAQVVHDKITDTWVKAQDGGTSSNNYSSLSLGAWVTSSSPVVPVPGALVLAATGLLSSLLGVNRWRRKR
jgi:hypothetical protein